MRFGSLLGCLQIIFCKITQPFPEKSQEFVNTSLLFDLNYKFINGSLAFSPG